MPLSRMLAKSEAVDPCMKSLPVPLYSSGRVRVALSVISVFWMRGEAILPSGISLVCVIVFFTGQWVGFNAGMRCGCLCTVRVAMANIGGPLSGSEKRGLL